MIEAYVRCKWGIRIPDLGMEMRSGQDYWLSLEEADGSKDLSHAARIGAVTVYKKERFRMVRKRHLPPFAKLSRGGAAGPKNPLKQPIHPAVPPVEPPKPETPQEKPPAPEPPKPPEQPKAPETKVEVNVDPEAVAAAVRQALSGELSTAVSQLVKAELQKEGTPSSPSAPQQDPEVLAEAISKALAKNFPKGAVSAPRSSSGSVSSDIDDAPLFMPSNIVDKNTKATVKIQEDKADSDINDAAAMLRALRNKGKKDGNDQ